MVKWHKCTIDDNDPLFEVTDEDRKLESMRGSSKLSNPLTQNQ